MRLLRLIGVAVVGLLASSCSDSTAPPTRVTALYVLESVGGQALPTTFSNQGWTFTVYSGTISLDAAGNSVSTDQRIETSGAYGNAGSFTRHSPYQIRGETIRVGFPCGNDILHDCAVGRAGVITESTLTLSPLHNAEGAVAYLYRLSPSN